MVRCPNQVYNLQFPIKRYHIPLKYGSVMMYWSEGPLLVFKLGHFEHGPTDGSEKGVTQKELITWTTETTSIGHL